MRGARFNEGDLYVMINAFWQPLHFRIGEGGNAGWKRVVDTSLPSPQDIAEPGDEAQIDSLDYEVAPRSVVVLCTDGPDARQFH